MWHIFLFFLWQNVCIFVAKFGISNGNFPRCHVTSLVCQDAREETSVDTNPTIIIIYVSVFPYAFGFQFFYLSTFNGCCCELDANKLIAVVSLIFFLKAVVATVDEAVAPIAVPVDVAIIKLVTVEAVGVELFFFKLLL